VKRHGHRSFSSRALGVLFFLTCCMGIALDQPGIALEAWMLEGDSKYGKRWVCWVLTSWIWPFLLKWTFAPFFMVLHNAQIPCSSLLKLIHDMALSWSNSTANWNGVIFSLTGCTYLTSFLYLKPRIWRLVNIFFKRVIKLFLMCFKNRKKYPHRF
jgi:hypothetical protein